MPQHSNIEALSKEVRRLILEADSEKDPKQKPVCTREMYARIFGMVSGALVSKGITLKQYESLYAEVQGAFTEWQRAK